MAEYRDKVSLFAGLSCLDFLASSVATWTSNGWTVGSFLPLRTIGQGSSATEIARALCTLIQDLTIYR